MDNRTNKKQSLWKSFRECRNKKTLYVAAFCVSTLLALFISFSIPRQYYSLAKIADEYKETDLLVGLSRMQAHLRNLKSNAGNESTNDIQVYIKLLRSEDFVTAIGKVQVEKYKTDYYHYIKEYYRRPFWETVYLKVLSAFGGYNEEEEIKQTIRNHIQYNVRPIYKTAELRFLDQDPVVAMNMLKAAIQLLQRSVGNYRVKRAKVNYANALNYKNNSEKQYKEAFARYAQYTESHSEPRTPSCRNEAERLRKEATIQRNIYEKAQENCQRMDFLVHKNVDPFAVVKNPTVESKPLYPRTFAYILAFGIVAFIFVTWYILYIYIRREQTDSKRQRSISLGGLFAPWNLTILVWSGVLILYHLQNKLDPITEQFYTCLMIWVPILCLSSFITFQLYPQNPAGSGVEFKFNPRIFRFFYIISMIITPLYLYRIMQLVMMFDLTDLMYNIRLLAIYGEGQGFLNYSAVLNQALLLVALWAYPRVPLWQVVTLVLACLLNSLAIMEKGTILFVFLCIIFVLYEKRIIKIRSIVVSGVILVFIFYLFNLARSEEGSNYQKNETLFDFLAMYLLSPPVAFCQLTEDVTPQFGTNTFGTIYLFLDRFGVPDIIVKQKLQDFVWVPIPTNVYTIFQPFFIDFGYKSIAFFALIYGVLSGWLYRLYKNGQSYGKCLYLYVVYMLVLQFYQENLFLSMVLVIQLTFFVVLLTQKKIRLNYQPILTHEPR